MRNRRVCASWDYRAPRWRRRPLGELAFAAFIKLTAIEAVVNEDAVIIRRIAPAIHHRMRAEIIGWIHVISSHFPRQQVWHFCCVGLLLI
jgi:hypothetical protein